MKATFYQSMVFGLLLASPKSSVRAFRRNCVAAFSSNLPVEKNVENEAKEEFWSPWDTEVLSERFQGKNSHRARQHVNPLAAKFQQQTVLTPDWPRDTFDDMQRPLFVDIGCSRGGFLVDIASQKPDDYNYLGLEIRPIVVYNAQQRVEKHNLQGRLGFVGCNANVDLERLMTLAEAKGRLMVASIQFPDPHFKARHAKRRVVRTEVVTTLAKFMPSGATVFLQSDIQSVLDDMRLQFREQPIYFEDTKDSLDDYVEENIFNIPTEREISVLDKGLPVYRSVFKRTAEPVDDSDVLTEDE
jgi:tRNA (guanine-N7-)-methyltransferase